MGFLAIWMGVLNLVSFQDSSVLGNVLRTWLGRLTTLCMGALWVDNSSVNCLPIITRLYTSIKNDRHVNLLMINPSLTITNQWFWINGSGVMFTNSATRKNGRLWSGTRHLPVLGWIWGDTMGPADKNPTNLAPRSYCMVFNPWPT